MEGARDEGRKSSSFTPENLYSTKVNESTPQSSLRHVNGFAELQKFVWTRNSSSHNTAAY